ncbi:hypothetical protein BDV23DRAFT_149467 [Aspergillus alliaceus]|uniref:Uncharacterized protein n=1 Tax=Petromyces alliaceus TaxID=209559 RepID=A0A5N7CIN7_PETAA|nr:hypothetical protein BDV23DRAFT_149467 [Aspergillus alliaceus]
MRQMTRRTSDDRASLAKQRDPRQPELPVRRNTVCALGLLEFHPREYTCTRSSISVASIAMVIASLSCSIAVDSV